METATGLDWRSVSKALACDFHGQVRAGLRKFLTWDGLWRSLVSALDWGSRGREFKSRQPDQRGPLNSGEER